MKYEGNAPSAYEMVRRVWTRWQYGPEREAECEGDDHVVGLKQGTVNVVGQEEGAVTWKERVDVIGAIPEWSRCAMRREG
jgi:hypothetical protein